MNRIPAIVGNWKMYKTGQEAGLFIESLRPLLTQSDRRVLLAPPFTAIADAWLAAQGSSIEIGGQNMHQEIEGAFTGEISAPMLKSAGAQFVILGHSERRTLFGETNGVIHEKLKTALKMGLKVILCIGETLKERDSSQTSQILQSQLQACLQGIPPSDFSMITIAYEPVWAIGTGKIATAQIAQETHEACRAFIGKKWGGAVAEKLSILYGGSVKPEHMAALMKEPDIDGVLVGGASLDVQAFGKIINF